MDVLYGYVTAQGPNLQLVDNASLQRAPPCFAGATIEADGQCTACPGTLWLGSRCHDECPAGYYCRQGEARECGFQGTFCPVGSSNPFIVSTGYESIAVDGSVAPALQRVRSSQRPCSPGSSCNVGSAKPCPAGTYQVSV